MASEPVIFRKLNNTYLLNGLDDNNFIYEFNSNIETLNSCNNEKALFKAVEGKIFENNLRMIDSILPKLLSKILLYGYINSCSSFKELTYYLKETNPLNLSESFKNIYYTHKINDFLDHLIRGLNSKDTWLDKYNIYKSYPVLKYNSHLLYYGENINNFKNAVFEMAYIELTNILSIHTNKKEFGLNLRIKIQ